MISIRYEEAVKGVSLDWSNELSESDEDELSKSDGDELSKSDEDEAKEVDKWIGVVQWTEIPFSAPGDSQPHSVSGPCGVNCSDTHVKHVTN